MDPHPTVTGALLDATRALLRITGAREARDIAVRLVHDAGGRVAPAADLEDGALPIDISFGSGPALLPVAPHASVERMLLERVLPGFVEDAARAIALVQRAPARTDPASHGASTPAAGPARPGGTVDPEGGWIGSAHVSEYLAAARAGDHRRATGLVLGLVEGGAPADAVIEGLLATAQQETGFRWHRGEWTIADEHVVTATTTAVVEALSTTVEQAPDGRRLVVVCAEGDWHSLPARLFAERMRIRGWRVSFLGGSTPADAVAAFLARRRPDALAVTCSRSVHFAGAARLADVAHERGVPVVIGGMALAGNPGRALVLGADDRAASPADADTALGRLAAGPVGSRPVALDRAALALDGAAPEHAREALDRLARTLPAVSRLDPRQLVRTHLSLSAVVRVTAAALLVGDDAVWTDHADWQRSMLAVRGVPDAVFLVAVQAVADQLAVDAPEAARLIDAYVASSL